MTTNFIYWLGLGSIAIAYMAMFAALGMVAWAVLDLRKNVQRIRGQEILAAFGSVLLGKGKSNAAESQEYRRFARRIRSSVVLMLVPVLISLGLLLVSAV